MKYLFRANQIFNGTIGSDKKVIESSHLMMKRRGDTVSCIVGGVECSLSTLQQFFNGEWINGIMIGFQEKNRNVND